MNNPPAQAFPCKNCGAQLHYDAASQGMACPFCGFKQAVQASNLASPNQAAGAVGAVVRDIPLEEGMRMAVRGLGAPVTTIQCKDCGATVNVGQGERTTQCAFCGSKQVLSAQTNESAIRPESLLPFAITKDDANKRFGDWLGSLWFRPSNLKRMAKVQEMGGVYVPYWTFNSAVFSQWNAERGWHYYEEEEYRTTENGQTVTRTRQVQRTRWEYASGSRSDWYEDLLVCAGRGLPPELAEKLSSFDCKRLVAYQPQYLAGWRAEAYVLELMPGWERAQGRISSSQEGRCGGDVGGDTRRNLSVNNQFSRTTFKHVLLPIWIAAYRYGGKPYQFLVNGQTGEVVGKAPWSLWKIFFLVASILIAIGAAIAIYNYTQDQ